MSCRILTQRRLRHAFTLIEIVVVVALLAIISTVAIPAIYHVVRKSPIREATDNLVEGCRRARMLAIMEGAAAELVINATDGSLVVRRCTDVLQGGGSESSGGLEPAPATDPETGEPLPRPVSIKYSGRIPDSVAFRGLIVNLQDMMDSPAAAVRFYPNGTADAFVAVLYSEQNEERRITLEITTGRETVEATR